MKKLIASILIINIAYAEPIPVFKVTPNDFKVELKKFALAIGVKTLRWSQEIKPCHKWQFDSTFIIPLDDKQNAIFIFFDGFPLQPMYFKHDHSLNIATLEALDACN